MKIVRIPGVAVLAHPETFRERLVLAARRRWRRNRGVLSGLAWWSIQAGNHLAVDRASAARISGAASVRPPTSSRRCQCGVVFQPKAGGDPSLCRRCARLVCPGCGGPTANGAYCGKGPGKVHPGCQSIAADYDAALREYAARERQEKPWPRAVGRIG